MDYSQKDLIKSKKILTSLLFSFDAFCKKHDLNYYACAGTCLGAIRHKGFIPWDDDIDVVMPRRDYEKMLSLKPELQNSNYTIYDISDKGYYLTFAKFCETKTTLVERKGHPFVIGLFIDIFPLDEANDSQECRKLFKLKNQFASRYFLCIQKNLFNEFLKAPSIRSKFRILFYLAFGKLLKKYFFARYNEIEDRIKKQTGDYVMFYGGNYGFDKELHDKQWFGQGLYVPFENGMVKVPSDYKSYLKKLYNDYMVLPPPEKRIIHHYHYFFDFEKRWKIEDIMKLDLEEQEDINFKYE